MVLPQPAPRPTSFSRPSWGALVACAAALLLSSRAAKAENPADLARARDLFREGSALAEAGDWKGALDRFERSAKLKRAALTLYNLGVAEVENGRLVDALDNFHTFLGQPTEPATARYVEPVKAAIVKLEARVAHLAIEVTPKDAAGVAVRVDGRDVPLATSPRALDPGVHEIVAVAPGFGEVRETASLAEGGRATVSLRLEPRSQPSMSIVLPTVLTVGGVALLAGGSVILGLGAKEGLSHPDKGTTATLLGGAGVTAAGAAVLGAGVSLLTVRRPARAGTASVEPWLAGTIGGVRGQF